MFIKNSKRIVRIIRDNKTFKSIIHAGHELWQAMRYLKGYTIGGNAEVKVGKNLWDEEWEVGAVSVSGALIADSTRMRPKNYIPIKPNTTYYFGCAGFDNKVKYIIYYGNEGDTTSVGSYSLGTTTNVFTSPSDAHYIKFSWEFTANYGNVYNHDIIIAEGSTAVPYEPYKKTIVGVGDEFAWNQNYEPSSETYSQNGITYKGNGDGSYTISGTATALSFVRVPGLTIPQGHKSLYIGSKGGGIIVWNAYSLLDVGQGGIYDGENPSLTYLGVSAGSTINNVTIYPQSFDLTAMGIADRINSLEDFKTYLKSHSMMDKDATEIPYFGYDAGSVKTSLPIVALQGYGKVKLKDLSFQKYINGSNWLFYAQIPLGRSEVGIGGNVDYFSNLYDGDGTALNGGAAVVLPSGSMRWDSFNPQILIVDKGYETPSAFQAHFTDNDVLYYELASATEVSKTTYPLLVSSPLYNTDVAKFGAGVTRKMGKKVFDGTEGWTFWESTSCFVSPTIADLKRGSGYNVKENILSASYQTTPNTDYATGVSADKVIFVDGWLKNVFVIKDTSYTSADAWKAHLADLYAQGNPLTIIYELATPTTEAVDLPKIVDYQPTILTTDTEVVGECKAFSTIEEELADKWGVSVDKVGMYTFSENDGWYNEDYAEGRWRKDSLPDAMAQPSGSDLPHLYCAIYDIANKADIFNGRVIGITIQATNSVRIFDNTLSSVAEIKAKMAKQTIYYEKA